LRPYAPADLFVIQEEILFLYLTLSDFGFPELSSLGNGLRIGSLVLSLHPRVRKNPADLIVRQLGSCGRSFLWRGFRGFLGYWSFGGRGLFGVFKGRAEGCAEIFPTTGISKVGSWNFCYLLLYGRVQNFIHEYCITS
jgi:hypothetical protein